MDWTPDKKQEQRISRLCRMAGNIAGGLSQERLPVTRAHAAVDLAIVIERVVIERVRSESDPKEAPDADL